MLMDFGSLYYSNLAESLLAKDANGAIECSDKAINMALIDTEYADAYRVKGIAQRLLGRYNQSEEAFKKALHYLEDSSDFDLLARINRDYGMMLLDLAMTLDGALKSETIFAAERLISSSLRYFGKVNNSVEMAASLGFLGRLFYCSSFINESRGRAVRCLRESNSCLRGKNDAYELNNLVWLARVSPLDRWHSAPRAIYLALKSSSVGRLTEYLILLIGGDGFYSYIKGRAKNDSRCKM